jgi:hypothetical protein
MATNKNRTAGHGRNHAAILDDTADQLDRWGICANQAAALRKQARHARRLLKILGPDACEVQS